MLYTSSPHEENKTAGEVFYASTVKGKADYRQSLLDALRQWKTRQAPDVNLDTLELNLVVFSSLTLQKFPLARVRKIEFVVKDSTWWQKDGADNFPAPQA